MKNIFSKFLEFFDSKATLSNMRLNVTAVTFSVCICTIGISVVLCYMYLKKYTDGGTILGWGGLLVTMLTSALAFKNSQAKTEQQNYTKTTSDTVINKDVATITDETTTKTN